MLQLTKIAISKIKEISESEDIGHYSIRVKLRGGGCAGWIRELDFDNLPKESDEVLEFDGIKIIVDQISGQYLNETTIDYEGGLMGGGFKFISKDITGSCGCGKSVSY